MWGGVTTPDELRAIADVAEQVQDPDRQGDRRPAHRPARRSRRRTCPRCGRSSTPPGMVSGPGLCQGPAHGEDLRRQRMVPVRHPGFDRARRQARALPVRLLDAGEGEARGLRLPAQLRRGDGEGHRHHLRRVRLRHPHRRRRRPACARDRSARPRRDRGGGDRIRRRGPAALSRAGGLSRTRLEVGREDRPRQDPRRDHGRPRRPPRAARAVQEVAARRAQGPMGRARRGPRAARIHAARRAERRSPPVAAE